MKDDNVERASYTSDVPVNPALCLVKEVFESKCLEKVAELLTSGNWIAISATRSKEGCYLFVLGRVV